jgi:AraC family transcriptional regulator of adaptative response/methylated-DNA-[protein]-cysteine methyltransferase
MHAVALPPKEDMCRAVMERDRSYDGLFFTGIRTTGVFCRPICPARKPLPENIEFYRSARDALLAGYRPCKRCHPMELNGSTPAWIRQLLAAVDEDPSRRWTDADLRTRALDPGRVRRWFKVNHGMTFHAYQRARRLGLALGQIRLGDELTRTAYDHGYESESGFREAFARFAGDTPGRSRSTTLVTMNRLLTPLGPMVAGATEHGICLLEFADRRMLETQIKRLRRWLGCAVAPGANRYLEQLNAELGAYFSGSLQEFTVPIVAPATDFQRTVWNELRRIPYGETRSYRQIAQAVGRPTAIRAVGHANGDNRLTIVIPCHRVIRSDGKLCGYGGGLWRKKFLLEHEQAHRSR